MRLRERLYLVGSGSAGFSISGPLDANCYLVDTGEGLWLFDVGYGGDDQLVRNVRAEGLDPHDITRIFLTHNHADHAGGLAGLVRTIGSPNVAIAAELAPDVRSGDTRANGYDWAQRVGFYPTDRALEPAPVDTELHDGQVFEAGDVRVTALHTPGHCRGHFGFLLEGLGTGPTLVSGDQVFWNGAVLLQNLPDVSIAEYAASMERLVTAGVETLLPGHSGFSLSDGHRHIAAAANHFSRIGIPPSLF